MTNPIPRVLSRLSRVTSGGSFVPEIDGLRFVAIGSVVLYHVNAYLLRKCPVIHDQDPVSRYLQIVLERGWFGVPLFFVVSGFILAVPFAAYRLEGEKKVSLSRYFLRRLTRLEPPYIINLLLVSLMLVTVEGRSVSDLAPNLGASLVYLHNLIYRTSSAVNRVAWSLEIEVQFYVLVPLLSCAFIIAGHRLRRGTILAAMACIILLQKLDCVPHLETILSYLQYFLTGFLLADIYIVDWRRQPPLSPGWDIVSLAAWSAIAAILVGRPTLSPLLPLAMLAAYMGAFRGIIFNRIFTNQWITTTGGMCYTIYLYHLVMISVIGRRTYGLSQGQPYYLYYAIQALMIVPLVLICCAFLFALLERPFMQRDWPQRLANRLRRGPCAPD